MAKTEVILTHNIVGLGGESDHVKVAAGYARNYLFPQGLAIPLTGANKRRIEVLKQRRAEREAHELNTMSELSKSISKLLCVVTVKTGEDGKMFGTVTSGMIADQLKTQFEIALDKKKIHLDQPIRALGEYQIELRLHPNVTSSLKVRVESSTPLPEAAAAPAGAGAEARKEEHPRTEKRGRRPEPAGEKGAKAPEAADRKSRRPEPTAGKGERPPRGPKEAQKTGKGPKAEKPSES